MTGRELYRKFLELGGGLDTELKDDWYRLGAQQQIAWEDLAEWAEKKHREASPTPTTQVQA